MSGAHHHSTNEIHFSHLNCITHLEGGVVHEGATVATHVSITPLMMLLGMGQVRGAYLDDGEISHQLESTPAPLAEGSRAL